MGIPFAIVKNKERLGRLVHQKNVSCIALTESKKEDQAEIEQFSKAFMSSFNNSTEWKNIWGGGKLGIKSTHKVDRKNKLLEDEKLKKLGM